VQPLLVSHSSKSKIFITLSFFSLSVWLTHEINQVADQWPASRTDEKGFVQWKEVESFLNLFEHRNRNSRFISFRHRSPFELDKTGIILFELDCQLDTSEQHRDHDSQTSQASQTSQTSLTSKISQARVAGSSALYQ
jgi:hypothetical protein